MQNLNESFKDVGLLPTLKPHKPRGKVAGPRRNNSSVDILEKVPADALHMLLPLWPGETDPVSAASDREMSAYDVPSEERQYLLVYYAPFKDDRRKKPESNKKRVRGETTSGGSTVEKASKSIELTSFRVVARLISYSLLQGTGVRLPVDGLSITGPMSKALALVPPSSYLRPQDHDDIIIGRCTNHGKNKDVHFDPEGLAKLGLCLNPDRQDRLADPLGVSEGNEEADSESWELTPIGRAAVEMAWLGCLAVTSFGGDALLAADARK